MNSAINLGVEDMTSTIVQYGLYLTALFQIVCLAAVVFVQDESQENFYHDSEAEDDGEHSSEHSTPQTSPRRPIHHRIRKQEKKKRR
ncbi:unnamed protein product [Brassicogethes aeneus]|uniref:Protein anon-73B1 n=1 Tax=Brassicogethes aeneus TaxID=1431903 RepID=A0A9P0FHA5_BRAAE|nr:unnamed protein product [Brassicogethes aeneus]